MSRETDRAQKALFFRQVRRYLRQQGLCVYGYRAFPRDLVCAAELEHYGYTKQTDSEFTEKRTK